MAPDQPTSSILLVYAAQAMARTADARTALDRAQKASAGSAHSLALVSPGHGEGRSLLAAELAIAFSQLRRRTLLIDADLRHPRQHALFGAENVWGLAQVLALGGPPRMLSVE